MKNKLLLLVCILTFAGQSFSVPGRLIDAIDHTNPEKMRELLKTTMLTADDQAYLLNLIKTKRQIAQQKLDATYDYKDILRLTAGSLCCYSTVVSTAASLFLLYQAASTNDFDRLNYAIAAAIFAATSGTTGYLAHAQCAKGFTKHDRKNCLTNALALEDLIHTAYIK